jgi:nitroreductase
VETWDAIRARRNVRSYTSQLIDQADLDRILEAGRRAPSARNWQPWDFVVVTGQAELTELARVSQSAGHVARSAATIALVGPRLDDERRREALLRYDLGQATMSMLIEAADLGIGSGHAGVADQDLARRLLGFPDDRFLAYLIALGYPADRPLAPLARPDRRPFQDVVHWGRW